MPEAHERGRTLGLFALRAAAFWLAGGALFKLLLGGPQDLPPAVQDLLGGKETLLLKYRLAITIELGVAALAILRPGIGWWLTAGALVVFEVILAPMIAAGEASCGCFGGDIPMPPAAMAAIDGLLLVGILAGRPWSGTARPVGHPLLVLVSLVVACCAPLAVDREAEPPQPPPVDVVHGDSHADPGDDQGAWPFKILTPGSWVGQLVYDIEELQGWVDFAPLPIDGTYIFYRQTCTHCAEHLEQLANADDGTVNYVLLRIVERDDSAENRETVIVPTGPHVTEVEMPRMVEYALTTPADFTLEGGVVVEGREGIEVDE